MLDDALFQDSTETTILTPYLKIRKSLKLTQPQVSEITGIPIKALTDYEKGRRDPTKHDVRLLDQLYGCEGRLLMYWLTRFSVNLRPPWYQQVKEKFLRYWHSEGTEEK